MRHFLSLLLGLVIAPAVWITAGLGQAKLLETTETGLTLRSAAVPLTVLAGAGLVFGALATTRISPVGPLTAGLLLIAVQGAYLARAEQVTDMLPKELLGTENVFTQPAATGLGAVLGAGLLVALFSLTRWRRWPEDELSYAFLGDSGPLGTATTSTVSKSDDDTTSSLAGSSTGSKPSWSLD